MLGLWYHSEGFQFCWRVAEMGLAPTTLESALDVM